MLAVNAIMFGYQPLQSCGRVAFAYARPALPCGYLPCGYLPCVNVLGTLNHDDPRSIRSMGDTGV